MRGWRGSGVEGAATGPTARARMCTLRSGLLGTLDVNPIMQEAVKRRHTSLDGKTALVTGGTKGIGRACVVEMAALGAQVITCSRKEEDIAELVKYGQEHGLNIKGYAADVSSKEGRTSLLEKGQETIKHLMQLQVKNECSGKLDIIVNNVGTNVRLSTEEYDEDNYHKVMSTNLDSAFLLTKDSFSLLKASGNASVIMMSSIAGGPTTLNSGCPYAISKAALDQFARYTACEWAQHGIRVNSVKPGYVETPLVKHLLSDKRRIAMIRSRVPMRRVGQPEEIAGLIAFLASPAAAYLTGQCIAVDGGFSSMGMWPIDDVIPFSD